MVFSRLINTLKRICTPIVSTYAPLVLQEVKTSRQIKKIPKRLMTIMALLTFISGVI